MNRSPSRTRAPIVARACFLCLSVALLAAIAGCKPKAGGSCTGGEETCIDKATALFCRGGVYQEASCKGPLGCTKVDKDVACDESVADEGSACKEDETFGCGGDKKSALVCREGKMLRLEGCLGPAGCSVLGHTLSCDTQIATPGDPCETKKEGAYACSPDTKLALVCTLRKWETYRYCRGEKGCTWESGVATCDEAIAEINDPCTISGRLACSTDGKEELICQGSHFMQSRTCPKNGCQIKGSNIKCE